MMSKNRKSKISYIPVFIILILILDLAFLYFIKYQNQSLSIIDFNLIKFGNLCNLFFTIILIIGITIQILNNDLFFETKKILPVFILNQSIIVIIFFSSIISLPFKEIYYLGQTGDELLIGVMFILYTFTYFVMIYLVWLNIFGIKNVIIVRAILNSSVYLMFFFIIVIFYIIGIESEFDDKLIDTDGKNVGVVLGAAVWSGNKPSPSLIGRVDKALLLYKTDKISQIYLTGSNAPGELTESEVAFKYLKNKDVEISKIFLEKETTSTNEQIQYIKKKLISKSNSKIVVISDSYHLVRVIEIAKFHNIEIQVSASELTQSFEKALYNKSREALALMFFWFFAI